jgi:hypothetical protein
MGESQAGPQILQPSGTPDIRRCRQLAFSDQSGQAPRCRRAPQQGRPSECLGGMRARRLRARRLRRLPLLRGPSPPLALPAAQLLGLASDRMNSHRWAALASNLAHLPWCRRRSRHLLRALLHLLPQPTPLRRRYIPAQAKPPGQRQLDSALAPAASPSPSLTSPARQGAWRRRRRALAVRVPVSLCRGKRMHSGLRSGTSFCRLPGAWTRRACIVA